MDCAAVGWADDEASGLVEDAGLGVAFQLVPELVGAEKEGDVVGVFEVGLADNAGITVGGAEGVDGVEFFESEDAFVAGGEMVGGGAAHASEAQNDGVVALGRHAVFSLVWAR